MAATLVATLLRELLDLGFTVLTAAIRGGSPSDTARIVTPLLLLAPPAYAPIVALLAFMYLELRLGPSPSFSFLP